MITMRKLAMTVAIAALAATGTFARAALASTPVTKCPVGSTCVTWQDTNTAVQQDIELIDHNGSPIFWCNNMGGCWVGNDRLGVTGSSVTNLAAYLSVMTNGTNGELVLDGKVLTGPDIKFVTCLNEGTSLATCRTAAAAVRSPAGAADHRSRVVPLAASTPVTQCPVDATCVTWQDTNTTGTQKDIELLNNAGSAIFWCDNSGGCWVGNDMLGVTGSSVFNLAAYLSTTNGTNGELVIDGQVLTGPDIQFATCLNEGGTIAACRTS